MRCPHDPTFECPHDPCYGGGDESRCGQVRTLVRRNLALQATQGEGVVPPPTLATMAGNLAKAVVAHVADGMAHAPPEVQAERKRICLSNECGHCIDGGKGCTACGCGTIAAISFIGLDMDEKRRWASSRCPLDPPLWEAVSS